MSKIEKLIESAQKNLQKGQISKAVKDYQKILEMDPSDIRNRQKFAELLGRERRVDEALAEYNKVAKHYTDNGFYLKAIAVYKQVQKLDPSRTDVYFKLAELNEKQGLTGNALTEYKNLVSHFEKERMLGEAVKVLEKIRDIDPENLSVHYRIVEVCIHGKLLERGKEAFNDTLKVFEEKGDFVRLLKLYELVLPHYSKDISIQVGFAQALIRNNQAEKGIQALKGILQRDPDNIEVQKALVEGYRITGDHENERLACQHLLKIQPDNLDLKEEFIRAIINAEDMIRTLDTLEGWRDHFMDGGRAHVLKGFYEILQDRLPDEDRIPEALHFISTFTSETGEPPSGSFQKVSSEPDVSSDTLPGISSNVPDQSDESTSQDPFDEDFEELDELEELDECETQDDPEDHSNTHVSGVSEDSLEIEEVSLDFLESLVLNSADSQCEGEDTQVSSANEDDPLDEVELEVGLDAEGTEDLLDLEVALSSDEIEYEELEVLEDELEELEEIDLPEEGEEIVAGDEPFDIHGELEEAEFYLQQGLLPEAENIYHKILEVDGANQDALDKLAEIEQMKGATPSTVGSTDEHFDLASELAGAVLTDIGEAAEGVFDDTFADSQKGVETQISQEDTESHYNLGIAYKEMGLLDDAIAEFEQAMKDPNRFVDCLSLKGMCLIEKGAFEEGEYSFKSALQQENLGDMERISLNYEMGLLYEAWNRPLDALDNFQCVQERDSFFRDVGEKIRNLREALGFDSAADGISNSKGSKDRVSYV